MFGEDELVFVSVYQPIDHPDWRLDREGVRIEPGGSTYPPRERKWYSYAVTVKELKEYVKLHPDTEIKGIVSLD